MKKFTLQIEYKTNISLIVLFSFIHKFKHRQMNELKLHDMNLALFFLDIIVHVCNSLTYVRIKTNFFNFHF